MIAICSKISTTRTESNTGVLKEIHGFLRGETSNAKIEVEKRLNMRIEMLESMNSDLCHQVRELDLKNTMLEDQIMLLDNKIQEVGGKIT